MSIDQKARRRYCGYCGHIYEMMTMEEFQVHMEVCEPETVRRYKANKTAGKDPYSETQGENMDGNCK